MPRNRSGIELCGFLQTNGCGDLLKPADQVSRFVVQHLRFHDSSNKAWLFAARANHAFSKRTTAYGTVGYIDSRGTLNYSVSSAATGSSPTPGGNQFGAMLGLKTIFWQWGRIESLGRTPNPELKEVEKRAK
ncbi:hypothetical protein ACUXAV_006612 [Cupriavidus metallidurans]|uniref:hypothetical protein n=1 Tax=Cupriavidus TaxID=106589 RepID=UPI0013640BBA|nr:MULTISPECIES: hypothetical protein [Cupriavidus]UAL02622.1 hypothetical protein K8O84_18055 [Cupriavidus pauculus]